MASDRFGWLLVLLCCLCIVAEVHAIGRSSRLRVDREELFKSIRENNMRARTQLQTAPAGESVNDLGSSGQRKPKICPAEDTFFYALDPRNPLPDFFVLGLNVPSVTEIITMFSMLFLSYSYGPNN